MTDLELEQVVGGYGEDCIDCDACNEIFSNFDDYRAHFQHCKEKERVFLSDH